MEGTAVGAGGEDPPGVDQQHRGIHGGRYRDQQRFSGNTGIGLCKGVSGPDGAQNAAATPWIPHLNNNFSGQHKSKLLGGGAL